MRWAALLAPIGVGIALLVLVAAVEPPQRTSRESVYRIAPGTADRVAAGLPIDEVLPPRLAANVGETLVVVNDDTASHVFGPFVLGPGQQWSQRFALDGDYSMTCSLYPNVDLVIAVAPAADPPQTARRVQRLWALGWCVLATVLVGMVAVTLALFAGDVGDTAPLPGPGSGRIVTIGWSLVGATVVLVALEALALSRLVSWRPVLSSRAMPMWMASLASTLGAAGLVSVAEGYPNLARPALIASVGAVALGGVVTLWTLLGPAAIGAGPLVIGAGFLGGALVAHLRGVERDDAATERALATLAATGFGLVLIGLPWPVASPGWSLTRGVLAVLVGVTIAWPTANRVPKGHSALQWLTRLAGVIGIILGLVLTILA